MSRGRNARRYNGHRKPAPCRGYWQGADEAEDCRRSVAGVLGQGRVEVELGLGYGPPHLVRLDGLHDPGIGVVVLQAIRPVQLILRIATHQVEPTLRLVRELQVTLDEDRVAQRQLVGWSGIVGRTGPVLGAGAVAGPGADHVEVRHGRGGVPELVLRLRIDQQGLGVAVERDVDVALAPLRSVVRRTVLPRQRAVFERRNAVAVPTAAAGSIAGVPAVVAGGLEVVVPRRWVPCPPAPARRETEVPRKIQAYQPAVAAAGIKARRGNLEDHLGISLVTRQERGDIVSVESPDPRIDDLLGPVGSILPLGGFLEVTGPPQVQVGERHVGCGPRGAAAITRAPLGGAYRLGLGEGLQDLLMDLLGRRPRDLEGRLI